MSNLSRSKNNRKKCIFFIGLLILSGILVNAEQKGKLAFGVYTGFSFNLGNEHVWWESGHVSKYFTPDFHVGGYIQSNLSKKFGLQFDVNYQHGSKKWIWSNWGSNERFGADPSGFLSFDLNGVFNYSRLKNAQLYLLGGCGFFNAFWGDSNGTCFNFTASTGVKIHPIEYPRSAINISGTFHHLLGSRISGSIHENYLRFNIGFEFYPSNHKTDSSN